MPDNTDFFRTAKIHALQALTEPNAALAQKSALAAEAMATIAVAEELRTANLMSYHLRRDPMTPDADAVIRARLGI